MPLMTNNEPRTEPAPADQDWFGGRRWTGIAAIGFLILVVVCVAVVLIVNHGSKKNGPNGTGGGPATTTIGPSSGSGPALPTTVPSAAPAGVIWSIYQTVALPSLAGAGPTKVSGAIATGYSHTPLGALLAVANEGFRYQLAPDAEYAQAANSMLASGTGKDAWLKTRSAHPYGASGAAGSDQLSQIAGFQFVSYTTSDAVIQLVNRNPDSTLQVGADHVMWDGSDWKFVPAADGGQAANLQKVDSLAGFTEWRGV